LQQPFFSLFGPSAPPLLDRAKIADPFVDADQLVVKLLETVELGDFLLRFAKRGRIGKRLGYCFSTHLASEPKLGIMTGIIGFGAVTGRFPALADCGSN
jgi:hypothetical protein